MILTIGFFLFGFILAWLQSLWLINWPLVVYLIFLCWYEEKEKLLYWLAFFLGLVNDFFQGRDLGKTSLIFLLIVFLFQLFLSGLKRKSRRIN